MFVRRFSSFIDKAKRDGVQALLGTFAASNGFDSCLKHMEIIKLEENGDIECILPVTSEIKNGFGTLHGGAICTIIDVAGTLSLLSHNKNIDNKPGVSIEINSTFCSNVKVGEKIKIISKVLKFGSRFGFTEINIFSTTTNLLIASGRHTKFF